MTKQELIRAINSLASEYLGFTTELAGLSGKSKETLQIKYYRANKMIGLSRKSKVLLAQYSAKQKDCYAIFGDAPGDYKAGIDYLKAAQSFWDTL